MLNSWIGRGSNAARNADKVGLGATRRPVIGVALGGGAARGFAHIGMLRTLISHGIVPNVVVGTSIGAVVGGAYACGHLDKLEEWARSLQPRNILGYLDIRLNGSGLIGGSRLAAELEASIGPTLIEDLPIKYATVATEVRTGHEIWLTHGRMVDAMRASYALPGIFSPVLVGDRWLVDGALVNPVPVSAARALGADIVIAINLNGDIGSKGAVIYSHGATSSEASAPQPPAAEPPRASFRDQVIGAATRINPFQRREVAGPSMAAVMVDAFNITQDRIARSRLAGDPPDVTIAPRVGRIGLFEFQRAGEAIDAGRDAVLRAADEIRTIIGHAQPA